MGQKYIYIYFLILIRHTIIKTKSGDLLFVWNSAKTLFRFCAYLLLVSRFIHKIIIRQGIVFYSFCFLLNLFLQGAGEPFTPSGQLGRRKQIFILQVITNFVRILFYVIFSRRTQLHFETKVPGMRAFRHCTNMVLLYVLVPVLYRYILYYAVDKVLRPKWSVS